MAGIAAGVALLFLPRRLLSGPTGLRRVLFEVDVGEFFNQRFAIERSVYRRHRLVGCLVLLGACAALVLVWYLAKPKAAAWLANAVTPLGGRIATILLASVGVTLAVVGTCLAVRPSVLKGIEAASNRWIDPMAATNRHMVVSRWILGSPRVTGAVLLAAGFACLLLS